MNRPAVIGLGSALMSDEAAGLHVARALDGVAGADAIEAGLAGFGLIHLLAGRQRVVLADCARMGCAPGAVRRFGPDDVRSRKALAGFSLHEGDLLSTLEVAKRVGDCPAEIVIFGIEPERIGPGADLTPVVRAAVERCVAQVQDVLAGWGAGGACGVRRA